MHRQFVQRNPMTRIK